MKTFDDYYYGYQDVRGVKKEGYVDLIDELKTAFPLDEPQIVGEGRQKSFIMLFGTILRMRNLLVSFDEFAGKEILTEREFQDYLSRYQDLYEEYKRQMTDHDKESINNDLVFEMELVRQIEINIDYILMMVIKYKESHCTDKEIVVSIMKAVDAGAELRSKKELIATFIENINNIDDVMEGWNDFVQQEKEKDLTAMISENNLKPEETRKFIAGAFRDGEIKTSGTEIDQLMPPMRRFGNTNRASVKQVIIDKLMVFFNKYRGIV